MEIERDEFGAVTYDEAERILELDWTEASARLTDQQFWLVSPGTPWSTPGRTSSST